MVFNSPIREIGNDTRDIFEIKIEAMRRVIIAFKVYRLTTWVNITRN